MGVNSLPKTVTRQRRGCGLNPGPSAPESSTLTTQLPSHPRTHGTGISRGVRHLSSLVLNEVSRLTDLQLSCHHDDVALHCVVSVAVGKHQTHVLGKLARRMILTGVKLTLHRHTDTNM